MVRVTKYRVSQNTVSNTVVLFNSIFHPKVSAKVDLLYLYQTKFKMEDKQKKSKWKTTKKIKMKDDQKMLTIDIKILKI